MAWWLVRYAEGTRKRQRERFLPWMVSVRRGDHGGGKSEQGGVSYVWGCSYWDKDVMKLCWGNVDDGPIVDGVGAPVDDGSVVPRCPHRRSSGVIVVHIFSHTSFSAIVHAY